MLKAPGAASLKIVIHPAEETANARAANYSYGVPGLTQVSTWRKTGAELN